MKYQIYDFYMKSGNVIRAAHNLDGGDLTFSVVNDEIRELSYSFFAIPLQGIGCPNWIIMSQIESIVFVREGEL